MKKLSVYLLVICSICMGLADCSLLAGPLANNNKPGTYARSIEQILKYNSKDIDLGTAAMIISEQWSENVLGRQYIFELDKMAHKILKELRERGREANYKAIDVINDYLYGELGFTTVDNADDPEDLFLHSVLDNKRGYCLSLSVLYLSLAERIGLELYGVVVPGHFFIRYDDGDVRFNIETTSRGAIMSDEHYIKKFNIPQDSDIYMKNLDKRQTLGCFFNNLGNSYSEVGDVEMAMTALEKSIEITPSLAESRTNLGNIYLAKGKTGLAIDLYQSALEINLNDSKVYNNLANAYMQTGLTAKAIEFYKLSQSLDRDFVDTYKNLARAYIINGDYDDALSQLHRGEIRSPKDPNIFYFMGEVYVKKEQLSEAIYNYEKALRLKPDYAEAYCGIALCHNMSGQVDDEIYYYKKAISVQPEMAAAMVNLGNAYFSKEKFEAAVEQYKKAVTLIDDDDRIYYNLGAAYSNLKLYPEAIEQYSKAIEINSQNADAHNGLGFIYYHQGKYRTAWKYITKAKQLGYDVDPQLYDAIESRL